ESRDRLHRIEYSLQTGGNAVAFLITECRWPVLREQEQVLPLHVIQHQRAGDALEHLSRRRSAASLLEKRVPRRTDVGALRDFLAAQARRTPTPGRVAERHR